VSTHRMPSEAGLAVPENGEGCGPAKIAPFRTDENTTSNCAEAAKESKRRATLTAHLARRGFALHFTTSGVLIVARWNLARELRSLDDVADFARRVGAA
jgi:hypothetical protein